MKHDYKALANELSELLSLQSPPLAITFSQDPPRGVTRYEATMPEPTPDGRTGKVPAGCVFWMKAAVRTFHTCAEDHGNCSVGSLTHGFITLDEAAIGRKGAGRRMLGDAGGVSANTGGEATPPLRDLWTLKLDQD
jgi:uncharacterized protein (DUF169 family)